MSKKGLSVKIRNALWHIRPLFTPNLTVFKIQFQFFIYDLLYSLLMWDIEK